MRPVATQTAPISAAGSGRTQSSLCARCGQAPSHKCPSRSVLAYHSRRTDLDPLLNSTAATRQLSDTAVVSLSKWGQAGTFMNARCTAFYDFSSVITE